MGYSNYDWHNRWGQVPAISEDVKNVGENWINLPGALFLKLSTRPHVAERVIQQIRNLLSSQLDRFNSISGLASISLDDFVEKFVIRLIENPSTRTIISAFYVFLLEHTERSIELRLKSTQGCSLVSIIAHLFSGGLIFESLLKNLYLTKDNGDPIKTLGQIFDTSAFKSDFGTGLQTSADTLQEILDTISNDSLDTAFCTTAKLRNTTGHNLVWDNIFESTSNYETLLNQIVNALFYVIEKKFIRLKSSSDTLSSNSTESPNYF